MDNLEPQLRRHFEAQQLPDSRVQALLAAGRAAGVARRQRRYWSMAAAALVMLGGLWWGAAHFSHNQPKAPRITSAAVARSVAAYFSNENYQLPLVSSDRQALVEWLHTRGGPTEFKMPAALAKMSSYGCQVLEVEGRQVYLICFLLEAPPMNTPGGAMPEKKTMMVAGTDGQMMKKTVPLVHLVMADKKHFSAPPNPGERVVVTTLSADWNYAVWTQGDQVYIAAGSLPARQLAGLLETL